MTMTRTTATYTPTPNRPAERARTGTKPRQQRAYQTLKRARHLAQRLPRNRQKAGTAQCRAASAGPGRRRAGHAFPIVGLGASAGGLEAVTELLHALPSNPGMAFVVMQHLDPTHESALPALLGRATDLPVAEAKHNARIEPNRIYVIPPNKAMRVADGRLKVTERRTEKEQRLPIDQFLESLADEEPERAIGVVINRQLDVLQFRGRTSPYLEHPHGEANLNLLKMVREGLMLDLRAAVNKASKQNTRIRQENVRVRLNGNYGYVHLEVLPFTVPPSPERFFLVSFEPVPEIETAAGQKVRGLKGRAVQTKDLELQDNKGHWWSVRIRPYKTTDQKIDGAVVAFVDVEMLKNPQGETGIGH